MGTNYYLRPPGACRERCDRWIHLGKSSAGWAFVFQASEHVNNYGTWNAQLDKGEIFDEYGRQIPADALRELVYNKRDGQSDPHGIGFYDAGGNLFIRVGFS